jgi:D-glycero-D-manno-heptose 1,7-bisphosphate phosphatase
MSSATFRSRTGTGEKIPAPMTYRHVILDRDGVLNREGAGYVVEPSQFEWLPGALDALAIMRRAGLRLSVATNQSGVGRGLMSLEQLTAVHERMLREASEHGGKLDALLVCPHAPDAGCSCRKPAPGLIEDAVARSGIPPADTLVVGDAHRDLEAAARAGVSAVLVRSGKGTKTEAALREAGIRIYDDVLALAGELTASTTDPRTAQGKTS